MCNASIFHVSSRCLFSPIQFHVLEYTHILVNMGPKWLNWKISGRNGEAVTYSILYLHVLIVCVFFFSVSLRMVSLWLCWNHCSSQRKMVLPQMPSQHGKKEERLKIGLKLVLMMLPFWIICDLVFWKMCYVFEWYDCFFSKWTSERKQMYDVIRTYFE